MAAPFAAAAAARPDSAINGVHVSTITYSYRSMPDQSAEAILRYVVDSGISAIEFMGGPVEAFAGAVQGDALRQQPDRGLGGVVGRRVVGGDQPGDRGDVDDRARGVAALPR